MGKLIVTFKDYGGEVSTATFPGSDLTEANITDELSQMTAIVTALGDVALGKITKIQRVASVSPQEDVPAALFSAQRETKWLVRYHDANTFEKGTLEVPCADLTKLDSADRGRADLTDSDVAAFVTALEAYMVGPGGNAIEVDEIVHVGRNL